MDIWIITVAFVLGFAANAVKLPPLVGYLAAGFLLKALGQESSAEIDFIADIGVLLLLFGIGLKIRLHMLARPVVWAGASIHSALTIIGVGTVLLVFGAIGLPLAADLSLGQVALVGFAFSFSSTVFAVKALEQRSETNSLQGRMAIGILVIQDIFAVVFLTAAVDTPPSWWAIPVVIAVVAARPVYTWMIDRSGHGELLLLFGMALAVGVGAQSFEQVGLKPDLGALLVGLSLASHPRAPELAAKLLDFKDILLIGFFLSIGLGGTPGPSEVAVALLIVAFLPVKAAGFIAVISRFRFRGRTSWHTSITLATYSEFGLIVAVVGVERGLLDQRWTSAIAVAVAASFVVAAPVNTARYRLYERFSAPLSGLERSPIHADDALIEPADADVIVFGMGRVGAGAYDEFVVRRGDVVLGIDRDADTVAQNQAMGRNVVRGDALDYEFWGKFTLSPHIKLVVLAMSDHTANMTAVQRVKEFLPDVSVAAAATHADQVEQLQACGVNVARNLYGEAGQGLADDACDLLEVEHPPQAS